MCVATLDGQLCATEVTATGLSERSAFPVLRKTQMAGAWLVVPFMLALGLRLWEMTTCSTGLGLGLLHRLTISRIVWASVGTPGLGTLIRWVEPVRCPRRPLNEIGKFPYIAAVLKTLLLCSVYKLNVPTTGSLGLMK